MSKIDRAVIEMMAQNMEYIQLGINNTKGSFSRAQWLYFLVKSYTEQVDGEMRADAIEKRNAANAGYTKAAH